MFRKMIATMALALFASTSFSASTMLDVSGLSDAQVAEIKAITAQKVAETANASTGSSVVTAGVTLAATWGQQAASAAEGFAKAMGIAARELNVTVNDFLKSDAGKLTALLIIWKVVGASLLQAMYGVLFLTVGLIMVRVIYVRLFTKEFIKVPYSRLFGAFTGEKLVRVPKSFSELRNEGEWMAFWVMITLAAFVIGFGGIFF